MRKQCFLGNIPYGDGAVAALGLLFDWPQLRHFTSARNLSINQNFDIDVILHAAEQLYMRGLLEKELVTLGKNCFGEPIQHVFYKRSNTLNLFGEVVYKALH